MGQRLTGKVTHISGGASRFGAVQTTLYACASVMVSDLEESQGAAVVELWIYGVWPASH
jgi:hypothetical protein